MTDRDTAIKHAQLRQAASLGALEHDEAAAKMTADMKGIEARIVGEIASATSAEDSKPIYSNPEKRKAELDARLEANTNYQGIAADLIDLQHQAATAKIDATYHADMVRVLCSFAEAAKAEVQ
jgi:hypothetical protein